MKGCTDAAASLLAAAAAAADEVTWHRVIRPKLLVRRRLTQCSELTRVRQYVCGGEAGFDTLRGRRIHTSDTARRQHLRSAGCHQLFVPRHRRSMFGRWAFSVAGPAAWNSLPDYLRDPSRSFDSFRRDLKTFLAHRLCDHALYKSTIDIDIDADNEQRTRFPARQTVCSCTADDVMFSVGCS